MKIDSVASKSYHKRDLKERRKFILVLHGRPRVNEAALIANGTIGSNENVVGDGLSENFDLQNVRNNFLGFAINIRVHKGDIVVAGDYVAQRRQSLLNPLNRNFIRKSISNVLQLLVRRRAGHQKPMPIPGSQASNDASPGDGSVHDGHNIGQFALKYAVKVLGTSNGHKAVRIGELGKDANVVAIFELSACMGKRRKTLEAGSEMRIETYGQPLSLVVAGRWWEALMFCVASAPFFSSTPMPPIVGTMISLTALCFRE